jgi:Ca2+-transporting ATPase
LQILYLNLVTDVFPAFALAMGEGEEDILKRPPRDPNEPIVGCRQWITIILHAAILTASTFGALVAARWLNLDAQQSVTVTFLTLAFAQLWHTLNMRNVRSGLFRNEITRNRWIWSALLLCVCLLAAPPYLPQIAHLLHLAPLTVGMGTVVLAFSLAPLIMIQTSIVSFQYIRYRFDDQQHAPSSLDRPNQNHRAESHRPPC